jgi:hypothetical protein
MPEFHAKPSDITSTIAVSFLNNVNHGFTDTYVVDMLWQGNGLLIKLNNGQCFIGEFHEVHPNDARDALRKYIENTTEEINAT